MSTYELTVNIESPGTNHTTTTKDGITTTTPSLAGHMWYSINDGKMNH